jgi:hypothetical protein
MAKNDNTPDTRKVVSPEQQAKENAALVEATNSTVEKAGAEAASRLEGQSKERFNVTDAILGADDDHSVNVKRAQAATFGEEYDPKTDPELNPAPLVPNASQNQNNAKHPADAIANDPLSARNYLGQLI